MPELPEVETMVRGIRPALVGRTIKAVVACPNHCKPLSIQPHFAEFAKRQVGRTIAGVRRLGKRVVIDLSDGQTCTIEPRMTGLVLLNEAPDAAHLRIEWKLGALKQPTGSRSERGGITLHSLWFWDRRGLGTLRLDPPGELERWLFPTRLGTDALELTTADWATLCKAGRRQIKVLLLDQTCVAGIGNLYASEILHVAGIHPFTLAGRLRTAQLERLSNAVQLVLREAIEYEGSTLGDGTYRNALNKQGGYQNIHRVYMKTGQVCSRCPDRLIERQVQAQRSTFFCRGCQK